MRTRAEATRSGAVDRVVVVGASAGGVEALKSFVAALPHDLRAAIFVVLHVPPTAPSQLARILSRSGPIRAVNAEQGKPICSSCIYVAVPDHHLLLEGKRMLLVRGPKENRNRPAINPLFRSAALAYGPRAVGVLLSGLLDDGTVGLWQIKAAGGLALVQDPTEARYPGMPQSALDEVQVDHCLPVAQLGRLLPSLLSQRPRKVRQTSPPDVMELGHQVAKMEDEAPNIYKMGRPSQFICPECQGTLFQSRGPQPTTFRCRVGHAYGEATLADAQADSAEDSLWSAMRALRENSDLLQRRAAKLPPRSPQRREFLALSKNVAAQANQIRTLIESSRGVSGERDVQSGAKR